MESGDLDFIVREHQERFPDGFFVRLGPRFLTEYYRSFLTGPHARGCVAELAGERVGFLVGVLDPTAHRSHVIKRHGRALTVVASTALMLSPALAWHFLRTRARRYIRRLVRSVLPLASRRSIVSRGTTAILTHVSVAPAAQARGVGTALIAHFVDDANAAGCERLVLVTTAGDAGAGSYYSRSGWTPQQEHLTPEGLRLMTYERILRPYRSPTETDESERACQ